MSASDQKSNMSFLRNEFSKIFENFFTNKDRWMLVAFFDFVAVKYSLKNNSN